MCKKPRAFRASLTCLVATAVPVGSALIAGSPVLFPASTASAGTPAVFAFEASPVGHHKHAAFGAGWSAFVGVARRVGTRVGGNRCRQNRRRSYHGSNSGHFGLRVAIRQLQIVRDDAASAEPARDIVQHGRNETN